ncbi:hypothetical protein [Fictibacillus gelatini]|uniref:hypothetical protein n=1 Tax=Fictibacillus gelatini TaxID=225985 RepID=UPI000402A214|nr:hypothetical protein [Fictibacillus gelatini]
MQGYIKDYRKELGSDIWMMPPLYHRVWQYLKYKVNHQENKIPMRDGTFLTIKAGQHLTSVRDIAKDVGWYEGVKWKEPNPKTISTILNWLENQSMITINRGKGNRQYTLITLLNWDLYQSKDVEGNSKETDREHPVDINKNDKECLKNEKDVVDKMPPQPEEHYDDVDLIAKHFMVVRGKPGKAPKVSDYQSIKAVLSAGVPLEEVLRGVDQAFQDFKPQYPGDEITSFGYCKKVILGNFYNNKAKEEVKRDQKILRYPGRSGRPPKKSSDSITGGQVGRLGKRKPEL